MEGLQFPRLENTESSERNADVLGGPLKDMETGFRNFEVPLVETFSGGYSKQMEDYFNAKSDRVTKYLPGITVRVSVRRFGALVRHVSISLWTFFLTVSRNKSIDTS
jgi:hypothetical protein